MPNKTKSSIKKKGQGQPKMVQKFSALSLGGAKKRKTPQQRPLGPPMAVKTSGSNKIMRTTFDHCERFATITTAAGGTGVCLSQFINAGNLTTSTNSFLSKQAALFEKYQFSRFEITYHPFVATTVAGNVLIGYDLSANDIAPTDGIGMTNLSGGCKSGSIWAPLSHAAQCFAHFPSGPKYIRTGTQQLGDTASLFDFGTMYIFTEGAPSSTAIGYLEVSYRVELIGVNRNSGEANTSQLRPVSQGVVNFTGTSITPGGLWTGTDMATLYGYNQASVAGGAVVNLPSTGTTQWGTAFTNSFGALTAGRFTLTAGTYELKLKSVVASDTYANGAVSLNASTINIKNHHGFAAATYPATAYVMTDSTESAPLVITIASTVTFTLSTDLFYSATVTANKTWNVVTADASNVPQTCVVVTCLSSS